jgi:hypothetical protein
MSELDEPSQPAPKTQRFALIETNAGAKTTVASITLSGIDEGKFRFELALGGSLATPRAANEGQRFHAGRIFHAIRNHGIISGR